MATTPNSIITPQTLNAFAVQFTSSNGTTPVAVFTAGANGSIIHALVASGTHTTSRLLTVKFYDGTTSHNIGALTIVAGSGTTNANPSVSVWTSLNLPWLPKDGNGNPYLMLQSGQSIQVVLDANTDATTTLDVCAFGENY